MALVFYVGLSWHRKFTKPQFSSEASAPLTPWVGVAVRRTSSAVPKPQIGFRVQGLLGGSWVVMSEAISGVIITHIGTYSPTYTHEPASAQT